MESIIENIKTIIEDVADIPADEIEAESSFMDDLDLASLEIMSVISKVEKAYSIKINEKELLSVETVSDLAKLISEK